MGTFHFIWIDKAIKASTLVKFHSWCYKNNGLIVSYFGILWYLSFFNPGNKAANLIDWLVLQLKKQKFFQYIEDLTKQKAGASLQLAEHYMIFSLFFFCYQVKLWRGLSNSGLKRLLKEKPVEMIRIWGLLLMLPLVFPLETKFLSRHI